MLCTSLLLRTMGSVSLAHVMFCLSAELNRIRSGSLGTGERWSKCWREKEDESEKMLKDVTGHEELSRYAGVSQRHESALILTRHQRLVVQFAGTSVFLSVTLLVSCFGFELMRTDLERSVEILHRQAA